MSPLPNRGRPSVLAAVLVALLAAAAARVSAENPAADEGFNKTRAQFQRKAKAARRAVNELDLTRYQARRLSPIVDQAAALYIEEYERAAAVLPGVIDAFENLAGEERLGQGLSPEKEQRAARLYNELRGSRDRLAEELILLEEQASRVLNRRQRSLANAERRGKRRAGDGGGRGRTDPLATAQEDLHELRQHKRPRVGLLGERLLHPAAGAALCEVTGRPVSDIARRALHVLDNGTPSHPIAEYDLQLAEARRLRNEMVNWNLINGLNLSGSQIAQILAVCERGERQMRAPGDKQAWLEGRERVVERILNPGQRQVLLDYRPCLIPPKNLKDPVRIGQAGDGSKLEDWLGRARRAAADRLDGMIDRILDREARHFGELSPADRARRKNLMLRTVRRAAAMSDVEFELNKVELAEQLAPPSREDELRTEIVVLSRSRGLPGPVAQLMLKPEFLDQLRRRGRQLAEGVEHGVADLDERHLAEQGDQPPGR